MFWTRAKRLPDGEIIAEFTDKDPRLYPTSWMKHDLQTIMLQSAKSGDLIWNMFGLSNFQSDPKLEVFPPSKYKPIQQARIQTIPEETACLLNLDAPANNISEAHT